MNNIIGKIENLFIRANTEIEDIELFRFGLGILFVNAIVIIIIALISIAINSFVSTMILLITLLGLRSKTGGYHFNSSVKCFAFSIIIPLILGWIFQLIFISKILLMTLSICASIYTMILAPIDHSNKRLNKNERRYFKKKTITSIFVLYLVIVMTDLVFSIHIVSKYIEVGILTNFVSVIFALIKNCSMRR